MEREDKLLAKYGAYPKTEDRDDIKKLLIEEIENESDAEGHEYLRVLCYLLFYIGNVEDSELIWKAKMLNMDAGCMVDSIYLCGAGYEETLSYIANREGSEKMGRYIQKNVGDDFDKEESICDFKEYYGLT